MPHSGKIYHYTCVLYRQIGTCTKMAYQVTGRAHRLLWKEQTQLQMNEKNVTLLENVALISASAVYLTTKYVRARI